jgi:hypothetical protein
MMEEDVLGGAAAKQDRHAILQLFLGHEEAILRGALHGIAERAYSPGNDRHLVHRVSSWQRHRHDGMTDLVISDNAPFLRDEEPVLLLESGNDALYSRRKIREMDTVAAAPCCQ